MLHSNWYINTAMVVHNLAVYYYIQFYDVPIIYVIARVHFELLIFPVAGGSI